jgi:hypothetical protein
MDLKSFSAHLAKGMQMASWHPIVGFVKTLPHHHLFLINHATSTIKKLVKPYIVTLGLTFLL